MTRGLGRKIEDQQPETPENGLAGLKHWKYDLKAGLIVSLVSVPLSLGIAVASGAPPVCGLISAIIAGLIFPLLGGAYMTISGPAAGLAPVVLASIITLGHGNMEVGYKIVLAVICLAGLLQLVLSYMKAARLSAMLPASAIQGMLAAIGIMIIAKEIPHFLGVKFHGHDFFGIISEVPHQLGLANPKVLFVGLVCLAILCAWSLIKNPSIRFVPPQLVVVFVGMALAHMLGLSGNQLIQIPDNVFKNGLALPDFHTLFTDRSLWWAALGCAISLCLVDGIESLATIKAIDKIDPYKRTSNPDRTLFAMGASNILSSLAGGLTIIPGGIKSTTCIISGGRTLWANGYNALFLASYLFFARDLINMIPFAALAAILMHIGWKLCEPRKWKHIAEIGSEQLLIFTTTIVATLATDLLWGLIFGTLVKFVLTLAMATSCRHQNGHPLQIFSQAVRFFRNPVCSSYTDDSGLHHIRFNGPVVCFNAMHVQRELRKVPAHAKTIELFFSHSVPVVDYSSNSYLLTYADTQKAHGVTVVFAGLDNLVPRSRVSCECMRLHAVVSRAT